MFTINQGFDLNSPQFNFKRDYFANVADLKAAPETSFPDHFITNVAGVLYQLTKSNSVNTTTGKWRKVKLGSDVDLSNYATKDKAIDTATVVKDQSIVLIHFTKANGSESRININNASDSNAGVMTANDKIKLNGIAVGANKYVLPVASATALGGIKLGTGLSATSDGTVSVSKDIVAGSVEWNNIKNKPNVTILGTNDEDMTNANSGCVIFLTPNNTDGYAIIGYDFESKYFMAVKQVNGVDSNNTYISADGVLVSYNDVTDDHNFNNIKISANGITLTTTEGVPSHTIFMADGTTQLLTAISTEELNKILV